MRRAEEAVARRKWGGVGSHQKLRLAHGIATRACAPSRALLRPLGGQWGVSPRLPYFCYSSPFSSSPSPPTAQLGRRPSEKRKQALEKTGRASAASLDLRRGGYS